MKQITHFVLVALLLAGQTQAKHLGQETPRIGFKENKGQVSDQFYKPRTDILFSGSTGNMTFHLKNNGISYQLSRIDKWEKRNPMLRSPSGENQEDLVPSDMTIYRLDINWINSNSSALIQKEEALPSYTNYYTTSCPQGALNVKSYSQILYKNIYPGIDLKWYENSGDLKYDYYVAAGADYKAIQFEINGAENISVTADGELNISTPLGTITEQRPVVMQNNKVLSASWIINNNTISFDIKNADPSLPLIIDPLVRLWGTFYGGSGIDDAWYTNLDGSGNVFITGSTTSASNIATSGAQQTTYAGLTNHADGYIVKFSPAGVPLWATYYGGTGDDYAAESVVDASGNVFLTGGTTSTNTGVISTSGSYQQTAGGGTPGDAFLVMLNSSGARQWGTYYGGSNMEAGYGISIDNSGNIYITGATQSTNAIATPGSYQPALSGGTGVTDGYLAKFNTAGVLQWGTYYGGTQNDMGWDCLNNAAGDVYFSGVTASNNGISTPGSHQPAFGGGNDAYFAKFNASGVLQWATYYGGNGTEDGINMSLDASGNIYSTGRTTSSTGTVIASSGSQQSTFGGGTDAYLVKFDPTGTRLWGTYVGGTGIDLGYTAVTDATGNVYLIGSTTSTSGTLVASTCGYQSTYGGGNSDAFLVKFTSSGSRVWGTYYGSPAREYATDCRVDASGNIYMVGIAYGTLANAVSSSNGYQYLYGGGASDAFLVKFDGCTPGNPPNTTPAVNLLVCTGKSTTLTTTCATWFSTLTGTVPLSSGSTFTTGPLSTDTTFYLEEFSCGSSNGHRTPVQVTISPVPTPSITNSNPFGCMFETATLTGSGATSYTWTNLSTNTTSATQSIQLILFLNTTFSLNVIDANGCEGTASINVVPNLCQGIQEQTEADYHLSAYPNPGKGSLTIQAGKAIDLDLINELGQTLRTIHLNQSNSFSLTIYDIPGGVYFLRGGNQGAGINKKIVTIK